MNKNLIITILLIIVIVLGFMLYSGDATDSGDVEMSADKYTLTIKNVSDSQPLSPGVFVIHSEEFSLNFEGNLSPVEFEPLAEYGSNEALKGVLPTLPGVVQVIAIDAPVLPGATTTISFEVEGENLYLSGIQMAVGSNDGIAVVNKVALDGEGKTLSAVNYDNGTEENEELLSGFDGGQPDPSRGEENIENGTATDPQEAVSIHPQLTSPIMEISLTKAEEEA